MRVVEIDRAQGTPEAFTEPPYRTRTPAAASSPWVSARRARRLERSAAALAKREPEILEQIVAGGRRLHGHASRVYFKLNNNVGDAPAINGIQIRELLGLDIADRDQVQTEWRRRRRRR